MLVGIILMARIKIQHRANQVDNAIESYENILHFMQLRTMVNALQEVVSA
jgi:hypothetical protein